MREDKFTKGERVNSPREREGFLQVQGVTEREGKGPCGPQSWLTARNETRRLRGQVRR